MSRHPALELDSAAVTQPAGPEVAAEAEAVCVDLAQLCARLRAGEALPSAVVDEVLARKRAVIERIAPGFYDRR